MDIDQFWQIIAASIDPSQDEQLEKFKNQLRKLNAAGLEEFSQIFSGLYFAAYSWDIWVVPWICEGGLCSDDSFSDFRSWLISRGRNVYESALQNPDDLAEEMRTTEYPYFESFHYLPAQVYRDRIKKDLPESGVKHPKQPIGGDWIRPALKDRSHSKLLNLCVVFSEMGQPEYDAIEKLFPKIWSLCLERGIIKLAGQETAPDAHPQTTVDQVIATVDPNLAKTDFPAFLQAITDAAQKAWPKKD